MQGSKKRNIKLLLEELHHPSSNAKKMLKKLVITETLLNKFKKENRQNL